MQSTALTVRQREWHTEIEAQQRSGLSQRAWCDQRGIPVGTFAWWKHQLRSLGRASEVAFVDVVVAEAAAPTVDIVLRHSGHRVVVGPHFDERLLRRVIAALETAS